MDPDTLLKILQMLGVVRAQQDNPYSAGRAHSNWGDTPEGKAHAKNLREIEDDVEYENAKLWDRAGFAGEAGKENRAFLRFMEGEVAKHPQTRFENPQRWAQIAREADSRPVLPPSHQQNPILGLLAALGINTKGGVRVPGNIDLRRRPIVKNADGSFSTVRSMSVNFGNGEVLIPTISDDGLALSDEDAIKLYQRTGRHLGIFDTPESATAYAQMLHMNQAREYAPKRGNHWPGQE